MMVYSSTPGLGSDTYAVEVLSDADLIRFVENLKKQVRILRLENEVLEATIMILQPSLMTGVNAALEYACKLSQSAIIMDGTSRSRLALADCARSSSNIKSQSRIFHRKLEPSLRPSSVKITTSIIGGTGLKINVEKKLELLHAVMENQEKDLMKFRSTAMKQNAFLKAQLEEIDLRTIDFEKWTLEFKQEVMIGGVEAMTKRIPAEIWIRFMTEQGKKIDRQIDKMRLRASTTNSQHRKLKEDIKLKKDLKSALIPVDIEIKTIEITNALKTIERKNNQLIELKEVTGDANLNITRHKDDLMTTIKYLKKVQQLTIRRKDETEKLHAERTLQEVQVKALEQQLNWIQEQRKTYFVPDVLDYVRVKLEMRELNMSIKRLETSLSIKQCVLTRFKRKSLPFLKSTGVSKNASDKCEELLRVTEFNGSKTVCRSCGLLPRV